MSSFCTNSKQSESLTRFSKSATSSSICDIPPDVINEILFCMDMKTLCRLRSVSRWWNDYISNPTFYLLRYRHFQHQGWPQLQIYWEIESNDSGCDIMCCEYAFLSIDATHSRCRNIWSFNPSGKNLMNVSKSSCFGLLCIYGTTSACIYNPTTRSVIIDLPEWNYSRWDPLLAIGLVHSTNKFKVLRFYTRSCYHYSESFLKYEECKVLTIPEDLNRGWRSAPKPPSDNIFKPVFASAESAFYTLSCDYRHLFQFDLESEQWSEVKLPPLSNQSKAKIDEFHGQLCLVVKKVDLSDEIWLLKDRDKWVKKWVLNPSPDYLWYTPLHLDKEHRRVVMKDSFGELHYNRIEKGICEKMTFSFKSKLSFLHSIQYVETFTSLATLRDIVVAKHY